MTDLMKRFLAWAAQAEDGKGMAFNARSSHIANSAVRQGYGMILSSAGLNVFIINEDGRKAAS